MMYWGNGVGGWAMAIMVIGSLLLWGLVVASIVALVRYISRGSGPQSGSVVEAATPQRVLAERFARGEIDEDEYGRRLQVLRNVAQTSRTSS